MSDPYERLAQLDEQAAAQRRSVGALLRQAQERTRPANLAQEARNRALDFGLDKLAQARNALLANPLKTAGAAALFGAVLGYRPLGRWLKGAFATARKRFASGNVDETGPDESED